GGGALPASRPRARRDGRPVARHAAPDVRRRAGREGTMMADHSYDTEITLDDRVPLVRIVREFAASPEQVFRAHAEPELFAQWNGPRDIGCRIDHFDCRTGGSWRYQALRDGEVVAGFHGSFHEVRPGELIVQTFTYDGMPDHVALEKLVFERL